jgi:hypothetical protein
MTSDIRNADVYDALQADPLVVALTGTVFHVTSVANYKAIRSSGWILPNDGTRQGPFVRRAPGLTTCEKLGAVSLFDFRDRDRQYRLYRWGESTREYDLEWSKFLRVFRPVTVIMVLDAAKVVGGLASEADCQREKGQWIASVEVCHRGPLPLDHVNAVVIVPSEGRPGDFRSFDVPRIPDNELDALVNDAPS